LPLLGDMVGCARAPLKLGAGVAFGVATGNVHVNARILAVVTVVPASPLVTGVLQAAMDLYFAEVVGITRCFSHGCLGRS